MVAWKSNASRKNLFPLAIPWWIPFPTLVLPALTIIVGFLILEVIRDLEPTRRAILKIQREDARWLRTLPNQPKADK